MRISKKIDEIFLLKLFFICTIFSGIFAIISGSLGIAVIRLWKDFGALFFIIIFSIINIYKNRIGNYIVLSIIATFILLQLLLIPHAPLVIYQFKLDFIPILFFITMFYYFKNYKHKKKLINWLYKLIIILGILNSIFSIIESLMFQQYLTLLGIEDGDWGVHYGIRIITQMGKLRAPGLLTGFVQSGTISLLSYAIFLYYKKQLNINRLTIITIEILHFFGILYSTYKTSILGFILITFFYIIDKTKIKQKSVIFYFSSLIIFILFFYSSINTTIYNIVYKFNQSIANNSIYARLEYNLKIFDTIKDINQYLLGVGFGVNGTFGLDKLKYGIHAIPLDSTFLYTLSNYGVLGVLTLLLFIIFTIIKLKNDNIYYRPIFLYLLYIISLEFFFNNILVNFPMIFYLFIFIAILTNTNRNELDANS